MRLALFFTLALPAAHALAQEQPQTATGSVTGTVIDSITHQPIKKARVSAACPSAPIVSAQGMRNGMSSLASSTDSTGTFLIENLSAGNCYLGATSELYPQGARSAKAVNIRPGEKNGPVTLELIPGATLSGRIVDEDGDPISGCFVQTRRASGFNQNQGFGNANSSGDYRIANLTAGSYYVSARCQTPVFEPRPLSAGPDPPPSRAYAPQFYPLATDQKSAQAVTLLAGAEKPGVDFQMHPAPVTQIRGAISVAGGAPPDGGNVAIQMIPANREEQNFGVPIMRDNQKGTFEVRNVFPGSYIILAWENGAKSKLYSAFEQVDVKDRPVETALDLKPGADLHGTVTVDDGGSGAKVDLSQLQVQLLPDLPGGLGAPNTRVNADGTFTAEAVPAWRWRVGVLGQAVFLKSATIGPTDVTHDPFDFPVGASGELHIVVSTNMATISGTAPAGDIVLATTRQGNGMNSRGAQVDSTGHFTMAQIPPGTYRVSASVPGSPQFGDDGIEVTVKEGETVNVEVKQ